MPRKQKEQKRVHSIEESTPQFEQITNNSKKELEKANNALSVAKKVELMLIEKGYLWITKYKTSKLVSPDRAKLYFKDGWSKLE